MIVSTAVNAIPFGYDNVVLGFNTHFYLLLTFSMAAMWFLADARHGRPAGRPAFFVASARSCASRPGR